MRIAFPESETKWKKVEVPIIFGKVANVRLCAVIERGANVDSLVSADRTPPPPRARQLLEQLRRQVVRTGFDEQVRNIEAVPCGDGEILHYTAVCITVPNGAVLSLVSYCLLSLCLQGDVRH